MLLIGCKEGHPTCRKTRFHTPCHQGGNRVTYVSPGKWYGVYVVGVNSEYKSTKDLIRFTDESSCKTYVSYSSLHVRHQHNACITQSASEKQVLAGSIL